MQSQQRVVAVGEVVHPAVSRESKRAVLYDRLPCRLHDPLDAYLDTADAFDYVQFNKVYDLRTCQQNVKEVLSHGNFAMDPRKKPGHPVRHNGNWECSINYCQPHSKMSSVRWTSFWEGRR